MGSIPVMNQPLEHGIKDGRTDGRKILPAISSINFIDNNNEKKTTVNTYLQNKAQMHHLYIQYSRATRNALISCCSDRADLLALV